MEPVESTAPSERPPVRISVVIPLRNEAENVADLVAEIRAALGTSSDWEIVCIDDGSDDGTPGLLAALASDPRARLRAYRHDVGQGQSAAIVTGVRRARGDWVATIDGDGQNDPADIPRLLATLSDTLAERASVPTLVAGRRARRRDSLIKRLASRVANAVRRRTLGDSTSDTGCGLKAFRRADFLALPHFDHLHRFLPALFIREGGTVVAVDVNHRERVRGRSNYGVLDRLGVGLVDLLGVWWLMHRRCAAAARPLTPEPVAVRAGAVTPSEATP